MKITEIPPPASPLGYTVEEAARALGVARATIVRYCEQGLLQRKGIPGTRSRVTERSMRDFVRKARRALA